MAKVVKRLAFCTSVTKSRISLANRFDARGLWGFVMFQLSRGMLERSVSDSFRTVALTMERTSHPLELR